MTGVPLFIVNAFTERLFGGNPAAVMVLNGQYSGDAPNWPVDGWLTQIAAQNNLAETAFLIGKDADWHLRWFTPTVEVPLCGHATLASSHVLFSHFAQSQTALTFHTIHSGSLFVGRKNNGYEMDFPALGPVADPSIDLKAVADALGAKPQEILASDNMIVAIFETADQIRALAPNMAKLAGLPKPGLVATALADPKSAKDGIDCVSRFFAPAKGIDEDPVTGGAHCVIIPYWASRLGKIEIEAFQASKRTGRLSCTLAGNRVLLRGTCVDYAHGEMVGGG